MTLLRSDFALSREVEVYAKRPDGNWSCGSGCALGGFLVLTAAHVVSDFSGQSHQVILVRQLGQGSLLVDAKVAWAGSGGQEDAALLVVLSGSSWIPHPIPVRWGRLATTKVQSCYTVGFPEFQNNIDYRDTEQAIGVISPRTVIKGRLYSISVLDPPDRIERSPSPWAGMSGAGVFCASMLVGVVVKDPFGHNSRRLVAVPVSSLMRDEDFCNLVREGAEGQVSVEAVEFSAISAGQFVARSPGALLRADVSKVPFQPSLEFDHLMAWCIKDNFTSSVRLVVGPGGQGKTRLARALVEVMKSRGWEALFIAPDAPIAELRILAEVQSSVLVVVDYAEWRQEQHLAEIVKSLEQADQVGRLLLLARTAGEWREALARTSTLLSAVVEAPVIRLPPVDPTVSSRREVWQQAVNAFAVVLPSVPGYEGADWIKALSSLRPPNLNEARFDRFLEIHVHALTSLLQAGQPIASTDTDVVDILIRHESRYWTQLARTSGVGLGAITQKRVVAAATAWSAVDRNEAYSVLRSTPGTDELPRDERFTVAGWISNLYADDVGRRYWSRVQPDLIAEHIVGQVLNENDCPDLLNKAIGGVSKAQIVHALSFITQASVHYPHLDRIIEWIITKHPDALESAESVALRVERPVALRDTTMRLALSPARRYSRETFIFNAASMVICGLVVLSRRFAIINLIGYLFPAAIVILGLITFMKHIIHAGRGRSGNWEDSVGRTRLP